MSVRDFIAKVKVAFDSSEFTAGLSSAQKAYKQAFTGMSAAMEDFQTRGGLAMQTATQLSIIASQTEQYRQGIQDMLRAPAEEASSLESALAAASTVVTPELSIDGDYAKTMEALRQRALDWGSGTAEGAALATASADEFARTSYSMLSAGLKAGAAMNATSQAFILAKGTMGEASDAAELLAMAYNTMGDKSVESGTELQRLADVVAKTQGLFQIANLNQLSEGLKYAIPTAQRYKIEWEEISTIIGQLNTSGLTGSQAGTSFASMMAQMLKASQSLGFSIAYDESGQMSVIGTLQNIQAMFGSISEMTPQMQMAFDTAFGQEGSRALTLLMTGLESLESNYQAVASAEGEAESMAARMSDTYADKVARMDNARAAMQARLGTSTTAMRGFFTDIQTSFYNTVSAFLDTDIGSFAGTIVSGAAMAADSLLGIGGTALNVAAQLATFVAMTQQAGGVMALLKSGGSMIVTLFSGFGTVIMGFGSTVVKTLVTFGSGMLSIAKTIGASMTAALGPVGLVIAAVVAIGTAAYQVYKHWDQIKEFFSNLWETVSGIFTSAFEAISSGVTKFVNWVTTPFRWLADKIGGLLGWETDSEEIGEFIAETDFTAEPVKTAEATDVPAVAASADMDAITSGMADTMASFQTAIDGNMAAADASWNGATDNVVDFQTAQSLGTSWAAMPDNVIEFPVADVSSSSWNLPSEWSAPVATDSASVMQYQPPVVLTSEESGTVLSSIRDIVEDILANLKNRKEGSTITIQSLSIPQTDDIEEAVRFIRDLREQIEREQTA